MSAAAQQASITPVYHSQWASDAGRRVNDCGLACVSMFLRSIGDFTPVDALTAPDPTGLTEPKHLVARLNEHGFDAHIAQYRSLDDVPPYAILLLNYAPLRFYAQDHKFTGWHWLIYVGNDGTNAIVLDPDYWLERINEGDHKQYPLVALKAAFRPYPNNSLCTAVIVDGIKEPPKETDVSKSPYTATQAVNFRMWYSTANKQIVTLQPGETVQGYDLTHDNEGYTWRLCEYGGNVGWIADKFIKPASTPV